MKKVGVCLVTIIVVSIWLISFPVYAQNGGNATNAQTPGEISENNQVVRELDSGIVVRYITFDFDNEIVVIKFDSDNSQTVTITEALFTEDTYELNQQEYTINGTTTVQFDARIVNNRMAITIGTEGGLYPFVESRQRFSFTNDYTSQQMIIGVSGGGLFGVGIVFLAAYRREMKMNDEIEKVT